MSPDSKRWAVAFATAAVLIVSVAAGRRGIADPMVGKEGKVLVLEFSDYQCPACKGAEPVMRRLLDFYGDKIDWVHKNFPLERVHKHARVAAVSAVCAERQGKFRAYHQTLFDNQEAWVASDDPAVFFKKYAAQLGMDPAALEACMKDPAADARVTADFKEGESYNIRSTPTFFVNGTRLTGSNQLSLKATYIIDSVLKLAPGASPAAGGPK